MKIEILGVDKTNLLEGGTLSVTRISKERRTCALNLLSAASSYLPDVGQDIKIYDDSDNLIFGGCIKKVDIQQSDSGNSNNTVVESSIFSDGYNQLPYKRVSYVSYTTSYAGEIVEDLRAVTLNSTDINEHIGAGIIDNGAYFSVYKKSRALIGDIYDELADVSGFKWYIDDAKDLYFTQESSTPDAAHSLLSTGAFHDYFDVHVNKSLANYRNFQIVLGVKSTATGDNIYASVASTAQIAARQAVEGGSSYSSGVYMNIIRDENIMNYADSLIVANNALKQFGLPESISFKSYSTDWQPSTKLRVKLPKYGIDTEAYYLIEEVTFDKINANELVASIVATRRDESAFSSQKTDDDVDFVSDIIHIGKALQDAIDQGSIAAGSTGGIDADTLDGYHAADFVLWDDANFLNFDNQSIFNTPLTCATTWEVFLDAAGYTAAFTDSDSAPFAVGMLNLLGPCGVVGDTSQLQNRMRARGLVFVEPLVGTPTVGYNYDQEFTMFCQPYLGNVANGVVTHIYIERSVDVNGDPIMMWKADRAFGSYVNQGVIGWSVSVQILSY